MSEYRIKGETLTGIADAIRSKTGGTEPIPVPEMAAQIEGITGGGGGSSDDVRYVTFMSHDGTVKLGKKAVAVGDDCADPIARGVFDTPTRESDAQYNYAFAGWSKNHDNVLDDTALDAVTEDRVVYAVYAMTVRYYTITYYDSDGATVLKTESLAYGAMPSYTPGKDGYSFTGWEPELATVTGDASYTAAFVEQITFAGGSWADIARICEAGEAADYFAVGDTRSITCNGNTYVVEIIGIDHDNLADGSGKAGITCLLQDAYINQIPYHGSYAAVKWVDSYIRSVCNNTIYNGLEADLKNVVKQVTKGYLYHYNTGSSYETDDYVWLLSSGEAGYALYGGTGTRYAAFKITSPTAQTLIDAQIGKEYWLRDSHGTSKSAYYVDESNTLPQTKNVTNNLYLRFGFCV